MAITYHSGRRLQALSTDLESTTVTTTQLVWDTSQLTGYTASNSNRTVTKTASSAWNNSSAIATASFTVGNKFSIEFERDSLVSTSTMLGFNSSSSPLAGYGANFSIYMAGDSFEVYENGGWVLRSGGTPSASDRYKIEVSVNGDVNYYLDAGGTGTWVWKWKSATTASGTYYVNASSYSQGSTGVLGNSKVTTENDLKPTNVQVGSRIEETDTRKMYHYADNSTKGLKAYYRFEDNGTNEQTTGDGLGSSANITLSGNTSYTTGKVGSKALSFDGNQDYAQVGTSVSNFNFMHNTTHEFTIAFWLKRDGDNANGGGQGVVFGTAKNTGASYYGMCIRRNGTNAMFVAFAAGTNSNRVQEEQTGYSTDGGWHHIVITAKASDSTNSLQFWQDGVSMGIKSNATKVFSDTNATTAPILGGNDSNNEQDFNGDIDNLNIWNRRLSDDEISTLYNSGTGIVIADGVLKAWSEEGT